jgi:hypothetical protein
LKIFWFKHFKITFIVIVNQNFFMKSIKLLSCLLLLTLLVGSCKKDKDKDVIVPPSGSCEESHLPIVFVHGTLASSDTWSLQYMRFESNSYCSKRLYSFDYNSLGGTNVELSLDTFIDKVLKETGASKVELVGHSQGGQKGYSYCSDSLRAKKVAHYVHVASNGQAKPAGYYGDIPTLNLSSADDAVAGVTTITGASNVSLTGKDHYEVATSVESFEAMYKFFNNDVAPKTLDITKESAPVISGRAVVMGDNTSVGAATVKIFEVDKSSGARSTASPQFTLTTSADGKFGPVTLNAATYYEFEITTTDPTDRVVHYYREPFIHQDDLVYLRIIPKTGIGASILGNLPKDDAQSVLAVFTANQAVVNGRDSLVAGGNLLSSAALSPASATNIAFFMYDDGNGVSNFTEGALFSSFPFLAQQDIFFPTATAGSIQLRFNGRNQFVPNLKSKTDGVLVAIFN